ncbi:MAG TPA: beta-1,6-N-acetylglucosaminyltransferase [Puia sp.]|jgi:hypothetical protein
MRIACVIIAHKGPQQIERFIKKFEHFPFDFYVHLDKKTAREPFDRLADIPNVQFIQPRIKVRWGASSVVTAMLLSIKTVLKSGLEYDFINIMTGQDYPIKPVSTIYSTLEKNRGKNFICYEDDGEWWSHAIARIQKYHFTDFGFRGRYRLQFLMNTLLPERKFPLPYTLYGGPRGMCMILSTDCLKYVVNLIDSNKRLRRFIRLTWGADEFLIPTLIMNSEFRKTVVNNNFYYIDWTGGGTNPKTLTTEDYESLCQSDKMFARKFDMARDPAILDMLDKGER